METVGSEPVNPGEIFPDGWIQSKHVHGLTKREYFAGLALQGILSSPRIDPCFPGNFVAINEMAIEYADGLIDQLNKL